VEPEVRLSSAREIWADLLRDADQLGFQVARVSDQEELEIGAELRKTTRLWHEDARASQYVTAVGETLLPNVRRKGIRYQFHVIESPQVNAFALPGGDVYVLRGMLNFLQSEAELATVIGHEISHVDLKHCIERYQYRVVMQQVGAGDIGSLVDMARGFVAIGYTQFEELEADEQGERLSIEAGYDPDAGPAVFARLQQRVQENKHLPAQTPAGEVALAVGEAAVSYFQTHPPSAKRERQLADLAARNRRTLSGRVFYVGAENYRRKIPRTTEEFPWERRHYVARVSPRQPDAQR
jgi:predicted Zn-dependent protease